MTLSQLEYIIAVEETGGFLTAATRSFVTQPTLSHMIKKLEDELGIVIFDRGQKPTKPTPAGERILAQAHRVVAEAKRMKDLVGEESKTLHGDLHLAIIPTLAPFLLPKIVRYLQKMFPLLHLTVEEMQTEAIIDRLHSGRLDLGVLVTPLEDVRVVELPVFYEPFYLYFSEGEKIAAKKLVSENDLDRSRMRLLSEGHCFRTQMLQLCRSKKNQSATGVEFEGGSLQTLKLMVDEVGGYTLLPYLACQELLTAKDRERIRPFVSPEPTREVSVVHHKHFSRTRAITATVESVLAYLPKDLRGVKKPKNVVSVV